MRCSTCYGDGEVRGVTDLNDAPHRCPECGVWLADFCPHCGPEFTDPCRDHRRAGRCTCDTYTGSERINGVKCCERCGGQLEALTPRPPFDPQAARDRAAETAYPTDRGGHDHS